MVGWLCVLVVVEPVTLHEPQVGGGGVRHGQDTAQAGRGCLKCH